MTSNPHPHTAGRAESPRRAYAVARATRHRASKLQREGLTLSEISVRMGYERDAVVQILYWEKVRA
jgi:hypothetical protein